MRKLYIIVIYIRRSPQRREQFIILYAEEVETEDVNSNDEFKKELVRDNDTRWNSVYLMGKRVIKLRDHIIIFLTRNREEKADKRIDFNNYLTLEDWRIITETVTLLKSFYDQIKRLQSRAKEGSRGGLWEAYTLMELLINYIKQAKM